MSFQNSFHDIYIYIYISYDFTISKPIYFIFHSEERKSKKNRKVVSINKYTFQKNVDISISFARNFQATSRANKSHFPFLLLLLLDRDKHRQINATGRRRLGERAIFSRIPPFHFDTLTCHTWGRDGFGSGSRFFPPLKVGEIKRAER